MRPRPRCRRHDPARRLDPNTSRSSELVCDERQHGPCADRGAERRRRGPRRRVARAESRARTPLRSRGRRAPRYASSPRHRRAAPASSAVRYAARPPRRSSTNALIAEQHARRVRACAPRSRARSIATGVARPTTQKTDHPSPPASSRAEATRAPSAQSTRADHRDEQQPAVAGRRVQRPPGVHHRQRRDVDPVITDSARVVERMQRRRRIEAGRPVPDLEDERTRVRPSTLQRRELAAAVGTERPARIVRERQREIDHEEQCARGQRHDGAAAEAGPRGSVGSRSASTGGASSAAVLTPCDGRESASDEESSTPPRTPTPKR